MEKTNKSHRLFYLDNIKIFLILLVVFHLLLMLIIQNVSDKLVLGSGGVWKFLYIGVVTSIVTFLCTWLVRMIPGVKNGSYNRRLMIWTTARL